MLAANAATRAGVVALFQTLPGFDPSPPSMQVTTRPAAAPAAEYAAASDAKAASPYQFGGATVKFPGGPSSGSR